MSERSWSEEWEAQAEAWGHRARTPGIDRHYPSVASEARAHERPGGQLVAALVHPFACAHLGPEAIEQRIYFDVQRTLDVVERDGDAFAFHQIHRPLQTWLALFFEAGFRIEALREPRTSEADVSADRDLGTSRATAAFLHVRCSR